MLELWRSPPCAQHAGAASSHDVCDVTDPGEPEDTGDWHGRWGGEWPGDDTGGR